MGEFRVCMGLGINGKLVGKKKSELGFEKRRLKIGIMILVQNEVSTVIVNVCSSCLHS